MISLKNLISENTNTIPDFDAVWKEILRSDGFRHLVDFHVNDMEMSEEEATDVIKSEQQERYDDIVYQYEGLEGEDCWRKITIPEDARPEMFKKLGVYWAVDEHAADAHWGQSGHRYNVKFKAKIELKNVDWPGTIFARTEISLGDEEKEIRFLEDSKIFVYEAKITGRIGQDQPKVIPINKYKLT